MKVKDMPPLLLERIGDMVPGTPFEYEDELWVKSDESREHNPDFLIAMKIRTGCLAGFPRNSFLKVRDDAFIAFEKGEIHGSV